jgi:hypothetical protein
MTLTLVMLLLTHSCMLATPAVNLYRLNAVVKKMT